MFPAVGQHLENCWPAGKHCCGAVTVGSGKIKLKLRFCNFDCFILKQKWCPQRNAFLILKKDEIGELVVEKDSKNTDNVTRTAVSTLRAFCDETVGELDFEQAFLGANLTINFNHKFRFILNIRYFSNDSFALIHKISILRFVSFMSFFLLEILRSCKRLYLHYHSCNKFVLF